MTKTISDEAYIPVKLLSAGAKLPVYGSAEAAGADLHALVGDKYHDGVIMPGKRKLFKTGISVELPTGYYAKIEGRSGLAYKHGIAVLGGVIDSDYRGDIGVILLNTGAEPFIVKQGDRIAQLIVLPYARGIFAEVETLGDTNRGDAGFGSTGVAG